MTRVTVVTGVVAVTVAVWRLVTVDPWIILIAVTVLAVLAVWGVVEGRRDG